MGCPDVGFLFCAVLVMLILSSYALIYAHVCVQELTRLSWLFVQHNVNGDWQHLLNWFPSVLVCLWACSPLTWHLPASE